MPTDYDCAKLCAACYTDTKQFDYIIETGGVFAGVKNFPEKTVIAFRGSSNFLDWQRDFDAVMINDASLGQVEEGFMKGLREAAATFIPLYDDKPLVVTGHSLGAARAQLFAALIGGEPAHIDSVVVFGSPRPGGQKLKDILSHVAVRSYRNRHDPVTQVPVEFSFFPYMHPVELTQVDVPPSYPDEWGLLADHHIELYEIAMEKLCTPDSTL